jgi:ubiquinone/menaquinone biosynthesis C-methylase UbiE
MIAGLGVILVTLLVYWAFVITEGAYLGARTVAWTYDLAARRYDDIKGFSAVDDRYFLARPMLNAMRGINCPLVLDVATGTGRLVEALFQIPGFDGTVVGLDLSQKMLRQAEAKLRPYKNRMGSTYVLIHHDAQRLPFPDEVFDAVACVEALEFMPSPERVLSEMVRVLRPGGVLLATNRVNWESKLMPGKAFADETLRTMLHTIGLPQVEIHPWQVYYDLIWARKTGLVSRLGHGTWDKTGYLRCPQCTHSPLNATTNSLHCPVCAHRYAIQGEIHLLSG